MDFNGSNANETMEVSAIGGRVRFFRDVANINMDLDGVERIDAEALGGADTVTVGDCSLEVIHIVGHTPGSIVLAYRDPAGTAHLWTGDSLFPGGVGNTFGDEAAFRQLVDDVEARIFDRLPDDTWFYPGHGDDSTLGAERPHLPEWRERGW